jgi:hypothetical protein
MGSSGYSGGNYGGTGGSSGNSCGGTLIIQLIINQNQNSIWSNATVNDDVYINLNKKTALPVLEVLKIKDNTVIGIAPPSFGWVINCISSGWQYQGTIIKKEGSDYDPRITVQLSGVK